VFWRQIKPPQTCPGNSFSMAIVRILPRDIEVFEDQVVTISPHELSGTEGVGAGHEQVTTAH
jgi:hypothetical protein